MVERGCANTTGRAFLKRMAPRRAAGKEQSASDQRHPVLHRFCTKRFLQLKMRSARAFRPERSQPMKTV